MTAPNTELGLCCSHAPFSCRRLCVDSFFPRCIEEEHENLLVLVLPSAGVTLHLASLQWVEEKEISRLKSPHQENTLKTTCHLRRSESSQFGNSEGFFGVSSYKSSLLWTASKSGEERTS